MRVATSSVHTVSLYSPHAGNVGTPKNYTNRPKCNTALSSESAETFHASSRCSCDAEESSATSFINVAMSQSRRLPDGVVAAARHRLNPGTDTRQTASVREDKPSTRPLTGSSGATTGVLSDS